MRLMDAGKLLMVMGLGSVVLLAAKAPGPFLRSTAALVQDQQTGEVLMVKKANDALPIASLTKLMTAMVILDAKLDLSERITILDEDKDFLRHSRSRLPVGTSLTREQAMLLALMSSENRAAHALGRTYPGGLNSFILAMNAKARAMGLQDTRFGDPAGLSSGNVASAMDLARIVDAAHHYPLIRQFSTQTETEIASGRQLLPFHNTNRLIHSPSWQIGLSKTGFINESGQCLVMQAQLANRPVLIVLLDASGAHSRFDDANRIRNWMEGTNDAPVQVRHLRAGRSIRSASKARAVRSLRSVRKARPGRKVQSAGTSRMVQKSRTGRIAQKSQTARKARTARQS